LRHARPLIRLAGASHRRDVAPGLASVGRRPVDEVLVFDVELVRVVGLKCSVGGFAEEGLPLALDDMGGLAHNGANLGPGLASVGALADVEVELCELSVLVAEESPVRAEEFPRRPLEQEWIIQLALCSIQRHNVDRAQPGRALVIARFSNDLGSSGISPCIGG
jgi:hypothetical protein